MDIFLKAIAAIFITIVVCAILAKQGKDVSVILVIGVCCMIGISAMHYLQPVIQFFHRLNTIGDVSNEMISIILKAVGIALLGEISQHICNDSGNASLGKVLQILATAVILWMSIPLFTGLIELVEQILESV